MLLRVENLRVAFRIDGRLSVPVRGVSFEIPENGRVALVGESGCGKSLTALALGGLVDRAEITGRVVGSPRIAYVFQNPMQSLDPVMRVGKQIEEGIGGGRWNARPTGTLLEAVGLPADAAQKYSCELSGGQQQRVMIAMALAQKPDLLVADEPTTALDVTTQREVLDLIARIADERRMAVLLITHNLGLVARYSQFVNVMYAGEIVERGEVADVLRRPRHPYTQGLLAAVPRLDAPKDAPLVDIPGTVPPPWNWPSGCAFHPRCPKARPECATESCASCSAPEQRPAVRAHGEGTPGIFVYSTDGNYVKLTAVSMVSLLTHNPGARVVVLVKDVSASSLQFLNALCERFGGSFSAIDVATELGRLESAGASSYASSYSVYARLFIPQLMPDAKRVVYLDADTLVNGDLSPLFDLDLSGKPLALAYDCLRVEYKKMIGLPPTAPYYNTGVMVLDCEVCRRTQMTERVLAAVRDSPARSLFPDQDLIARTLGRAGDIALLPPAYNFLAHYMMFRSRNDVLKIMAIPKAVWFASDDYAAAREHPQIYHFAGRTLGRPWYRESKHPIRPLYRRFAELAGVPEVAEQSRPLDLCYRVQYLCWRFLPNALFVQACRALYRIFFLKTYGV